MVRKAWVRRSGQRGSIAITQSLKSSVVQHLLISSTFGDLRIITYQNRVLKPRYNCQWLFANLLASNSLATSGIPSAAMMCAKEFPNVPIIFLRMTRINILDQDLKKIFIILLITERNLNREKVEQNQRCRSYAGFYKTVLSNNFHITENLHWAFPRQNFATLKNSFFGSWNNPLRFLPKFREILDFHLFLEDPIDFDSNLQRRNSGEMIRQFWCDLAEFILAI